MNSSTKISQFFNLSDVFFEYLSVNIVNQPLTNLFIKIFRFFGQLLRDQKWNFNKIPIGESIITC